MASKRRVIPLYFGKREDDLWEVIQAIPEGDRNHEIRQALRAYFLGEEAPKPPRKREDKANLIDQINVGLNSDLIK